MAVSPKTVRNLVSNIFSKLQVADRAEAIAKAREAGLGVGGLDTIPVPGTGQLSRDARDIPGDRMLCRTIQVRGEELPMRKVYVTLTGLLVVSVVIQFYFAAFGVFTAPQNDSQFILHSSTGGSSCRCCACCASRRPRWPGHPVG